MSPELLGTLSSSFIRKTSIKINEKCFWASSLETSLVHPHQRLMEQLLELLG